MKHCAAVSCTVRCTRPYTVSVHHSAQIVALCTQYTYYCRGWVIQCGCKTSSDAGSACHPQHAFYLHSIESWSFGYRFRETGFLFLLFVFRGTTKGVRRLFGTRVLDAVTYGRQRPFVSGSLLFWSISCFLTFPPADSGGRMGVKGCSF